ncbi:MAG TPA: leucine--tRNA ligase [Candidatus Saccharimonadales bacterium]|nr:leucine--tRNA ligase [Candidatus Saccharimonadales bacterium]
MKRYNPKDIEPKWQKVWEDQKIYQASEDTSKPKKYILEYFPYPSGAAMHVGHVRNYTIGDAVARFNRMQGNNVLHPMGWDAFGLPAENYAIKTGISPRQAIDENTKRFKQQLMQMGFSYDWSREIDSTDPKYYRWTQWFFLLLFKKGLAYQQESLQWWCPHDKTVLANEQVEAGLCWRCGNRVEKKALKQWFFKITDYADRLDQDLEKLDWSDAIKSMQHNWIGKSTGAEINFALDGSDEKIKVFTTRPDTIYGATFMVLAPEHPLIDRITTAEHKAHVNSYVKAAQAKSDVERQETEREKTGAFTGAHAINPATGEKIPVWVADYVLMGYGTGAIMAVPAHDERDHDFAKKFDLPIREVVIHFVTYTEGPNQLREGVEGVDREVVDAIIVSPDGKYLLETDVDGTHFVGGGTDGEEEISALKREILEEVGYDDIANIRVVSSISGSEAFRATKGKNQIVRGRFYEVRLASLRKQKSEVDDGRHTIEWVDRSSVAKKLTWQGHSFAWQQYESESYCYAGEGRMINSAKYDNMSSAEAREKIVADLEKKGVAHEKVNYKMRDWLISRQRYWGAPIPIIHCPKDGAVPVPEDQLPVELPELKKFEPSGDGRSPLANVVEWVNTTCPKCGGKAQRETDTMDGFACSSWYFLRFANPHNDAKPFDKSKIDFWLPVDDYIGGAEHAVMHLLYARFWTKVMFDEGMIDFDEPFTALRNQGMILAPDGAKMSKSKGNTIEPDGLIEQGYGADAIRIMELFVGPWNQAANWSVEGMGGAFRFLQRVWTLVQEYTAEKEAGQGESSVELLRAVNKTAKKVSQDLENMGFNTAIAAQMELVNELFHIKAADKYAAKEWRWVLETLLQLLAPFAPHITEELWCELGHEESIHISHWPAWDEKYLAKDTVIIAVQVNGKVRGEIELAPDASQDEAMQVAQDADKVKVHLDGKQIVKTIYVPGKIVNIVVK